MMALFLLKWIQKCQHYNKYSRLVFKIEEAFVYLCSAVFVTDRKLIKVNKIKGCPVTQRCAHGSIFASPLIAGTRSMRGQNPLNDVSADSIAAAVRRG